MKVKVIEATSPAIIPGTIFDIGDKPLTPGTNITVSTKVASYEFNIDRIDALEDGSYRASNSNNIFIFRPISNG